MATVDAMLLNKSEMFATIRKNLPVEREHTQNLLECKDDLLYAWNAQESCVLVINWRAAHLKGFEDVKHQCLMPATMQNFQVELLLASNEGSLIALAGPRGVTVMEVPRRWGPNGLFMEGKAKITCRSFNLDAQFFSNNPHLELRQLRWHPDSHTDSHLLVLLSDNTIRVYDHATLRHVWQVGPVPLRTELNANRSTGSRVFALGESAVDFDIAPAVKVPASASDNNSSLAFSLSGTNSDLNSSKSATQRQTTKVERPLIVLRENGNIYVLMTGLDTDKPRLQGPLTITPQTVDNYGLDSCSILVIPSLPTTLVIAETNGKLHHALLLEAEQVEESFNEIDISLNIHPAEWTVHVLETVELELGLPKHELDAANDKRPSYKCALHLKRDYINELRYFAYHNTGLHVISVNFISELQRYLKSDVAEDIISLSTTSSAEYIVCTKIDTGDRFNAVLGFVLLQMPSFVVLLLSSGQAISLKIITNPHLLYELPTNGKNTDNETLKDDNADQKQLDELLRSNFVDHIKNLLKRTVTQPILSLDKSATPSSKECYELLTQTIEVLSTQYVQRHKLVADEFKQHIAKIRLRCAQQLHAIKELEHERELIREQAHRLAERFEEISEQQEFITKHSQDLMRQANTCLPCNAKVEKEFSTEVESINKATNSLTNSMAKAKENLNKQWYHIAKYNATSKLKAFELPEKQEHTIKEILLQITSEIDGQIKEVKRLSKIVEL